jgi:aldehyde dehydrogenase (NAD+)/betaine-aldehyde dehydrogenase
MAAGPLVRPAVVDGKPLHTGQAIDVLDPSTGRRFARVARCGADEVDEAVAAARRAFEGVWRHASARERSAACRAVAAAVRAHSDELARLETLDTGKPLGQARADVDVAARYFEFYAGTVEALYGETLMSAPDLFAYALPEPHGVCGHITPWNYPLQVAARTVAPALAAGNCCLLKPAEDAPLTSLRLAELAVEAGLPAGALNVVPGYGEEAGEALAAHPGLDHLAFTGSREVGRLVMARAAENIVPVLLELGGKSPHLVLADADLDAAVPVIVESITEHAGQNCSAGSRLLVHEQVHDRVVRQVAAAFRAMRIGPGSTDPDLGPLISAGQRRRVLDYVESGRRDSRLVTGGGRPADPALAGGFFVEPTLFDDVPPGCALAQEEVFGPVLAVTPFSGLEEAVALANGTTYGLNAGLWTRDVGTAHRLVREMRAGQVFVNRYSAAGGVELPFGGCKASGFGREKGFEALRSYCRSKAVVVDLG